MNHLTPCFPLIAKLVRQLDRLQSFSWHAFGNIPYSILRALHEHSNIRALDLHFYNCMQAALDIGLVKGLKDLERTPKLRAALLEISTHNLEHNTSKRRDPKNLALNKAVVQAPLLQTLTLRISHDIVWHEHEDRSLLRLSPEDEPMLQSLTNLKIHGPSAALHEGFLQAVPSYRLRVLELWHCGDCSTLLDILSNQSKELQLHTLKMEGRPNRSGDVPAENEAIESFLVSFEGLQELVLRGQAGMQMASITWHHNTLRSLSLIDSCDNLAPPDMRDITDHQMVPATRAERARKLEEIRGGCPNLRSLRINDDCGPLKHSVSLDVAIIYYR